ncbi:tyrosine--tRNA ligase [Peptostreptococcaceae bacterium oral taxon 113 str. W5053]|nr:tyrosine--tRNA ligase [Peptostreptococcaceae bacterium oral taxon 113 str. W5053]
MIIPGIFDELTERGYFEQASHPEELKECLDKERVTFYCGFDATADSLTLGHFVQLMVMKRMQNHGHRPIALLGGGTTMIGDPSARNDMRKVMGVDTIDEFALRFKKQFERFLDFGEDKAIMENNADWLRQLNYLNFMREYGVHFSVNRMLAMDSYKNRLETGLTFFEFGYLLLQSYDFLELNRRYNCKLQIGGSDQWSNIIGGMELIRKTEQKQAYAMTFKLLTTADGKKMGKSQKGAVWLDEEKTTPYEMFQYMRNIDDRDVEKFLLQLTFLPTEECKRLGSFTDERINEGKEILAYEVVKTIHGESKAKEALETSRALFAQKNSIDSMPTEEIDFKGNMGLLNLLRETGLTASNAEARRLVEQGGITVNDEKITDPGYTFTEENFKEGFIILRKGKKIFRKIVKK